MRLALSHMGRVGIEPTTLGLKVRRERPRRTVANGNVLQRRRFAAAVTCDELWAAETSPVLLRTAPCRSVRSLDRPCKIDARANAHLVEHVVHVTLDRLLAEEQLGGDL